jgi:molybdopterin synthase catalytic subunit
LRIKLLYFAYARTVRGKAEEYVELADGTTVEALRAELATRLGAAVPQFQLARNAGYANPRDELQDGDEVAVIPPVSGGLPLVGPEPVDVASLIAAVSGPDKGAISVFLGTVRNEFEGKPTAALHYEAYNAMAERELAQIVDAAERRHGCRVSVYHRTGTLQLEEVSVGIAAAAAHRAEAFAACREVIEEIKLRVPVWKREISPEGLEAWHGEVSQGNDGSA